MQRVTTLASTNLMNTWIGESARRLADGERQVATGERFSRASEAPADAATVMRNQRSLGRLEQLQRNVSNARLWLDTADTALNDSVSSLTRARTLAVQGANDTNTPESRAAIAADIRTIADELISLANTPVNGRPIFAGTADTPLAYDASGAFLGDGGQVIRAVTRTDSFAVAASGPAVFGTANGADPLNGSAFEMLNAVADAIEAGDVPLTRQGLESIDTATSRIQGEIGRLGGLSGRLAEIDNRNEGSQIATRSQISDLRDVDMAEAIIRVRSAEASYEATLSAAGRTLGRSLLDFLR